MKNFVPKKFFEAQFVREFDLDNSSKLKILIFRYVTEKSHFDATTVFTELTTF